MDLEARLGDAITLAAAAERSSQGLGAKRRRGSGVGAGFGGFGGGGIVGVVVDGVAALMLLPVQICLSVLKIPGVVLGGAVGVVEDVVGRRVRREMRTAGRGDRGGASGGGSASERERERRRMMHSGAGGRGAKKAL